MKFLFTAALLALIGACIAAETRKQTIFTYPSDTPASVINQAMEVIRREGGVITHQFESINAFVAQVKQHTIDKIQTLSAEYLPTIEDDGIITINNSN